MSVSTSRIDLPNAPGISMPRLHLGLYLTTGDDVQKAVTYALDAGYRAFDTAQDYGNEGATAQAITAWLASPSNPTPNSTTTNSPSSPPQKLTRKDIHYTTKLATNSTDYATVRASISASVTLAPEGYVDLFLLHSPYGGPEARKTSWRALEDAVKDGEVRSIGVSNYGVGHINELLALPPRIPPTLNQIELHPFNTRPHLTTHCATHSILVQAYSPLVHGLRMTHPTITDLARKYGCSPAQVLLRWSLQRGFCPVAKSVGRGRIVENADVFDGKGEIGEEDLRVLDGLDEGLCTDWDPTDAE